MRHGRVRRANDDEVGSAVQLGREGSPDSGPEGGGRGRRVGGGRKTGLPPAGNHQDGHGPGGGPGGPQGAAAGRPGAGADGDGPPRGGRPRGGLPGRAGHVRRRGHGLHRVHRAGAPPARVLLRRGRPRRGAPANAPVPALPLRGRRAPGSGGGKVAGDVPGRGDDAQGRGESVPPRRGGGGGGRRGVAGGEAGPGGRGTQPAADRSGPGWVLAHRRESAGRGAGGHARALHGGPRARPSGRRRHGPRPRRRGGAGAGGGADQVLGANGQGGEYMRPPASAKKIEY